jgi:hypothetical protein
MAAATVRLPQFQNNQLLLLGPVALVAIAGWLYLVVLIFRKFL